MIPPPHFFEEAAEEIEHERQWYRERSHTAENLFREVDHAIDAVVEAPKRWPKYLAGTRRYVFPTFPFSFVYFEEQGEVFVVALAPESKRPGYWRDRLR